MSVLPIKTQSNSGRVVLKRVFRRDDVFVCGVCHKEHAQLDLAKSCFKKCMASYLISTTYSVKNTPSGPKYVCGYCARSYAQLEEVQYCLAQCRSYVKRSMLAKNSVMAQKRKLKRPGLEQVTGGKEKDPNSEAKRRKQSLEDARMNKNGPNKNSASPSQAAINAKAESFDNQNGIKPSQKGSPFTETNLEDELADIDIDDDLSINGGFDSESESDDVLNDSAIDLPVEDDESLPEKERKIRKDRRDQMYKYGRDGRILFCKKCGKEAKTLDSVIGCYDSHEFEEKVKMDPKAKEKGYTLDPATMNCPKCDKSYTSKKKMLECCADQPDFGDGTASSGKKIKRVVAKKDDDKFIRDGSKYVCAACNEKYFTKLEAINCFGEHEKIWQEEDAAREGGDDKNKIINPTIGGSEKFSRDGSKYVCRKCNKKHFTRSDVDQCFDSHTGAPMPQPPVDTGTESDDEDGEIDWGAATAEQSSGSGTTASANVKVEVDLDGDEKFSRNGSKYICKNCSKKYFTRMEVINCFDSHK